MDDFLNHEIVETQRFSQQNLIQNLNIKNRSRSKKVPIATIGLKTQGSIQRFKEKNIMSSLQILDRKASDHKANTSKSGSRLLQPKSVDRQGTSYGPLRPVDGFDSRDLSSKRKYSRLQDNMNLLNSSKGVPHPSNRVSSLGPYSQKTSRKNSVETRRTS